MKKFIFEEHFVILKDNPFLSHLLIMTISYIYVYNEICANMYYINSI